MGDDIKIAIGARTPLYLPLYLAEKKGFYGFAPRGKRFTITDPPANGDGDAAVRDAVATGAEAEGGATFGVCDPRVVLTPAAPGKELVAIAALVTRTGFWIYCNGCDNFLDKLLHKPEDLINKLRTDENIRVIVYPSGMTGHSIAKESIGAGLNPRAWKNKHIPLSRVDARSDFAELESRGKGTVLVTSNLLGGQEKYRQVYAYSSDGQHGNLFTVCLIANKKTIETAGTTTAGYLVSALQMAMIDLGLLATQSESDAGARGITDVVEALVTSVGLSSTAENKQAATKVVVQMCRGEALFPTRLTIDESMWAKMLAHHPPRSRADPIRNGNANAAYRELVLEPTRRSFRSRHYWWMRILAGVLMVVAVVYWNRVAMVIIATLTVLELVTKLSNFRKLLGLHWGRTR